MLKIKTIIQFTKSFPRNFYNLFINTYKIPLIQQAVADPEGIGMLNLRMDILSILTEYRHIFYEMSEGSICIDGGANIGLFTDLCLSQNAVVHLFEPNKYLVDNILSKKYKNNEKVILNLSAIGTNNSELVLFNNVDYKNNISLTTGGSIINNFFAKRDGEKSTATEEKVPVIDFCEYLKKNFSLEDEKKPPVYLCKLDIEGAEFDVIEKIIKERVYKYCKYILVEVHPVMFPDGVAKLENLNKLIKDNNISNIYLGWA